ncbi:hypothetical protein L210DRAFT_3523040 [Boletus edulis BED1]|uniref:Uncharacterized protein n=1 Tax=Boletus edulis BED1 TaxID=1328754 RepID=A0AAD4C4A4_BOLED|nr:hypothetical protein L210DRAFT_3523040 [Boletus edulis BED1]
MSCNSPEIDSVGGCGMRQCEGSIHTQFYPCMESSWHPGTKYHLFCTGKVIRHTGS